MKERERERERGFEECLKVMKYVLHDEYGVKVEKWRLVLMEVRFQRERMVSLNVCFLFSVKLILKR